MSIYHYTPHQSLLRYFSYNPIHRYLNPQHVPLLQCGSRSRHPCKQINGEMMQLALKDIIRVILLRAETFETCVSVLIPKH